ncbi:DUF6802 family protein [Amycolatopsis cihanbeyliensis]|uniref:DUF6802 domain-containing protein n=1 Tax=Amycolatopsis cihanbeyliensis TaxID=1128664 RepID=A0A542DKZ6_AMYCI|nr:DUF6802 family protein [Amycolatopsis cihanbeyliensis]TQJ03766.1 hypothetical protein FB471_3534 [Amycolatopsis cihanbeyliensis]
MWVDESGGTDTADTTGTPDEMTVTVEGEDYTADVNFDINEDGVDDTALIEREDGSVQAFVDVDSDGDADEYVQLDADGNLVTHAAYDETSGDWVSVEPGDTGDPGGTDTDTQTGSDGGMTADMPDGEVEVGPATVDTNQDGVNDTAVVQDESGNTIGFTDVDGDGDADVAVVIDESGESTTYEHTGDGQWTEVEGAGRAAGESDAASDAAWGGGQQPVEGVARIDSATGQWISQN